MSRYLKGKLAYRLDLHWFYVPLHATHTLTFQQGEEAMQRKAKGTTADTKLSGNGITGVHGCITVKTLSMLFLFFSFLFWLGEVKNIFPLFEIKSSENAAGINPVAFMKLPPRIIPAYYSTTFDLYSEWYFADLILLSKYWATNVILVKMTLALTLGQKETFNRCSKCATQTVVCIIQEVFTLLFLIIMKKCIVDVST